MNAVAGRDLVMLGAGGHARVLLAALDALGAKVIGCVCPASPDHHWPTSIPWLGGDDSLALLDIKAVALVNGIGSIGSTDLRRKVYEGAKDRGFSFASVVHPAAILAGVVTLGDGAQVMAGAVLQTGVRVGANAIVNTGAVVDHDTSLGAHCHVAPGACLSGGVSIGVGAHVGTGASIIQGITIGEAALVAAGAVVVRHVAVGERVGGVPARPLTVRREVQNRGA